MQVEHKTEKGTICFVKVPDDAFRISLDDKYGLKFKQHSIPAFCFDNVTLPKRNWQLIGLTREVTEEQAKMMVDKMNWGNNCYKNYNLSQEQFIGLFPIDSVKSIMQYLKIFETHNCTNPNDIISDFYVDDVFQQDAYEKYLESFNHAEERTGKWIVLFKPNES